MLTITMPKTELFDNDTQSYYTAPFTTLFLEHSLIAISKWEAKYKVPFFNSIKALAQQQHYDKFLYYVGCMSTKGDIPYATLLRLDVENIKEITEYIADSHTASISGRGSRGTDKKPITAERIYALMAMHRLPCEYARWHINNLLMTINICAELSDDSNKKRVGDPADTQSYIDQNEALRRAGVPL